MSIKFLKQANGNVPEMIAVSALVAVAKNTLVDYQGDGTVAAATTANTYAGVVVGTAVAPETIDSGDTHMNYNMIPALAGTYWAITPQAAVTTSAADARIGDLNDLNGTGAAVTVATTQGTANDVLIVGYDARKGETNIDHFICILNDRIFG